MTSQARRAYEVLAPRYDEFTKANDYEGWFSMLLPELERRGLRQGRLLDVGCGTGRAFPPMLKRDWTITGVDASPEMLEQARAKFDEEVAAGRVTLAQCDLRALPVYGEFELVICLNDVLNYCTEDADLERAFSGMRANLAEGGLVCFDLSSLKLFRMSFEGGESEWMGDKGLSWRGSGVEIKAGGIFEAEVFGDSLATHVHRERHWTRDDVLVAFEAAGLECLGEIGHDEIEGEGIVFTEPPDQERDHRAIYIAGAR